MSKITFSEFQDMLADIEVPEAEIAGYLIADPERCKPFAPALMPNPEMVDTDADLVELRVEAARIGNSLNAFNRLRRRRRFKKRVKQENLPIIYAEGDSWFQFPYILDDVVDHLSPSHLVWCSSAAGDTLQNMVFDKPEYLKELRRLKNDGHEPKAFLFSGAGNDVVGEDTAGVAALARIVKDYNSTESISWHIETDGLTDTLAFIEKAYRKLLKDVAEAFPGLKVLLHGYDRAPTRGVPDGDADQPFWAKPWTSDPLNEHGFPDNATASKVVAAILDRVNELTERICDAHPNAVYADLRNSVPADQWADELHPTNVGFAAATSRLKTFL